MIHSRLFFSPLLLGVILASCSKIPSVAPTSLQTPATSEVPAEVAPDGIKFLDTADTLEALTARAHADLTWQTPDGSPYFLWAKAADSPNAWSLTLDRAYHVQQGSKIFWAFLDSDYAEIIPYSDPRMEFLLLKHVRETIACPTKDFHDGNQSSAEILATRSDGSAVVKLAYDSDSGMRPNQEEIHTWLFYHAPNGKWSVATSDLGHEGSYTHTYMGSSDYFDIRIIWNPPNSPALFCAQITRFENHWVHLEGNRPEDDLYGAYTTCLDGLLDGAFPMTPKFSDQRYVPADGKLTLETLADNIVAFNDDWRWQRGGAPVADPEAARREIRRNLIDSFQKANPALAPNVPPMDKTPIVMPQD